MLSDELDLGVGSDFSVNVLKLTILQEFFSFLHDIPELRVADSFDLKF